MLCKTYIPKCPAADILITEVVSHSALHVREETGVPEEARKTGLVHICGVQQTAWEERKNKKKTISVGEQAGMAVF